MEDTHLNSNDAEQHADHNPYVVVQPVLQSLEAALQAHKQGPLVSTALKSYLFHKGYLQNLALSKNEDVSLTSILLNSDGLILDVISQPSLAFLTSPQGSAVITPPCPPWTQKAFTPSFSCVVIPSKMPCFSCPWKEDTPSCDLLTQSLGQGRRHWPHPVAGLWTPFLSREPPSFPWTCEQSLFCFASS